VPTEDEIRSTETSLQSVQNDLQRKQDELSRRTQGSPASENGSGSASWMKRVGDTLRGGDDRMFNVILSTLNVFNTYLSNSRDKRPSNASLDSHSHPPISTSKAHSFSARENVPWPSWFSRWASIRRILRLSSIHSTFSSHSPNDGPDLTLARRLVLTPCSSAHRPAHKVRRPTPTLSPTFLYGS
jgi:hypothetical protein